MTDPTFPGMGAEDVASRAALRVAKLRREQAIRDGTDSAAEEQLARAVSRQRNWSQGAEGERLVAHTLGALERYGWIVLHDIHQPGRKRANIDHVAVGPGGVVVIDAKNWTGSVTTLDGVLRQNGYARTREIEAVGAQSDAVAGMLAPEHRSAVRGALAVVAHDIDPVDIGSTAIVGRSALGHWLLSLSPRFSPADVVAVAGTLRRDLVAPRSVAGGGRGARGGNEVRSSGALRSLLRLGLAAGVAAAAVYVLIAYGGQISTWLGDVVAGILTPDQG